MLGAFHLGQPGMGSLLLVAAGPFAICLITGRMRVDEPVVNRPEGLIPYSLISLIRANPPLGTTSRIVR